MKTDLSPGRPLSSIAATDLGHWQVVITTSNGTKVNAAQTRRVRSAASNNPKTFIWMCDQHTSQPRSTQRNPALNDAQLARQPQSTPTPVKVWDRVLMAQGMPRAEATTSND